MPNWCFNRLVVRGPGARKLHEQMQDFIKDHADDDPERVLDFNFSVPMPEVVKLTQPPLEDNWYDWAVENWDTKWNARQSVLESLSDDEVVYSFATAWGAPLKVVDSLARLHPHLRFELEYCHEGDMETFHDYEPPHEGATLRSEAT